MIIRMTINMSGGRYDNRPWPPAGTDFEVPDDEGKALIRDRNAVFVSHSAMQPIARPVTELIASEPSYTGAGPVSGEVTMSPLEPRPAQAPPPPPVSPPATEVTVAPAAASAVAAAPATAAVPDEAEHEPAPREEMPPPPRPAEPKRKWEDYAVAQGMDPDDAVDATKAELMSKYGGRL